MSLQRILVKLRMFIKLSLITWMEVVFLTLFCLCAKCENVLTLRDTPQLRDIEGRFLFVSDPQRNSKMIAITRLVFPVI